LGALAFVFAQGDLGSLPYAPDPMGYVASRLEQGAYVFVAGAGCGLLYWLFAGRLRLPYGA
jgi:hypothetical protein